MQNSNEGKLNICVLPSGRAYVGICAKIGGRIEIPTEYDGHPVSHITEKAFSDIIYYNIQNRNNYAKH